MNTYKEFINEGQQQFYLMAIKRRKMVRKKAQKKKQKISKDNKPNKESRKKEVTVWQKRELEKIDKKFAGVIKLYKGKKFATKYK